MPDSLGQLANEAEQLGQGPAPSEAQPGAAAPPRDFTVAARGLVETAAVLVQGFTGVKCGEDRKAPIVDALAPVLTKYDGAMPPWIARWQEELNLCMAVASVGYGIYREYLEAQAAKKQPAAPAPAPAASPAPA